MTKIQGIAFCLGHWRNGLFSTAVFFQSDSSIPHILPRGLIAMLTKLVAKKVLNQNGHKMELLDGILCMI